MARVHALKEGQDYHGETECGQGRLDAVPPDGFANTMRAKRCQKCNGKRGDPPETLRKTPDPKSDPIKLDTARELVRALRLAYPTAAIPARLAVEVCVVAVSKTIDNERDARESLRRYRERHGELPPESAADVTAGVEDMARRLAVAPPCRGIKGEVCQAFDIRSKRIEMVPFRLRCADLMCGACAAMWHVAMAEIALRELVTREAEDAALGVKP